MADFLAGTVKTPFGSVKKSTAVIGGGFVVVLFGVAYYRSRGSAPSGPGIDAEINPATGFPYGSAEDAAAMASQAAYVRPGVGGSGGGGGGGEDSYNQPGSFTNNATWSQYAIGALTGSGAVSDAGPLTAALGKYLSGSGVNAEETSLINMAIAIAGKPPISGPEGYPPSIRTVSGSTPPANLDTNTKLLNVLAGYRVDQWINDVKRQYNPDFSWGKLLLYNPPPRFNPATDIDYKKAGSADNVFKRALTIRIRP